MFYDYLLGLSGLAHGLKDLQENLLETAKAVFDCKKQHFYNNTHTVLFQSLTAIFKISYRHCECPTA